MNRILIDFQYIKNELGSLNHELIILTTYFTSKKDPQRHILQKTDDYQYIKNWYESIIEHDLLAVVFYDTLSEGFIKNFENKNVKFIKCKLGEYSLNDERFFIYKEFLIFFPHNLFVLCTDINDVVVNRNPIDLFKRKPNKIFIGRGNTFKWRTSLWNLNKMKDFNDKLKTSLPSDILCLPVFNAGLLGGNVKNVQEILVKMVFEFEKMGDDINYNMAVLNYVLYKDYYRLRNPLVKLLSFKLAYLLFAYTFRLSKKIGFINRYIIFNIRTFEEGQCENDLVFSGFPFNSLFKEFEVKGSSLSFLIHK